MFILDWSALKDNLNTHTQGLVRGDNGDDDEYILGLD